MSEVNLNEAVEEVVNDAQVVTVPIDDTLSVSGEAADAKAVGDALALKADASSVVTIDVNGQSADNQGHIIIDGTDVKMSSDDNTTLKAAIENAAGRTGADIPMSSASGAQKIKEAVEEAAGKSATDIMMSGSSETTIAAKIATMDTAISANATAASEAKSRTAADITMGAETVETIAEAIEDCVKSVNGEGPDETGNVQVQHALTADNLTSSQSQSSVGEWTRRTSGGSASIQDGSAWLSGIRGNRSHVGYVPEVLNMTVVTAPREEGQTPITATIERDTFIAAASGSGTYNFVYTTSWSMDPATYGITVTGTPVSGDQIVVSYTAEDRGTIIQSDPQSLVATGWNIAKPTSDYTGFTHLAIALKYDSTASFKIIGTYTSVKFSATLTGDKTSISPSDGIFTIASNGYIWVAGGSTDTAIYMTWTDWILDGPTTAQAYTEDEIDLSDVMEECFPYGLLRAGDVRDEIDFNTGLAISNIERLAYSAENLATAEASGRTYEVDTNYIYLERATAVTTQIELDGEYNVSDHGLEYFTDTDMPVYAIVIYGNNLKNKLERDVVTKSSDIVDGLTSTSTDKALSAKQGKALKDITDSLSNQIANNVVPNRTTITLNNARDVALGVLTANSNLRLWIPHQIAISDGSNGSVTSVTITYVEAYCNEQSVVLTSNISELNNGSYSAYGIVLNITGSFGNTGLPLNTPMICPVRITITL